MKFLFQLILMLFPLFSFSQKKWYTITKNNLLVMGAMAVSGSADGLNQAIIHHRFGRGNDFWDAKTSWKNKYKDFDNGDTRPAFIGSKTWTVALTDGMHLTRAIDRTFMYGAILISVSDLKSYDKKDRWKVVTKNFLLTSLTNRVFFKLVYGNL